jgi:hypothetical protein
MMVGHNQRNSSSSSGGWRTGTNGSKVKVSARTFCEIVFDNNMRRRQCLSDNATAKAWNTIEVGLGRGKVTLFVAPKADSF